jgi:hypothetical protein
VFHTSLLRLFVQRKKELEPLPPLVELNEGEEPAEYYEVEAILKKQGKRAPKYLIK